MRQLPIDQVRHAISMVDDFSSGINVRVRTGLRIVLFRLHLYLADDLFLDFAEEKKKSPLHPAWQKHLSHKPFLISMRNLVLSRAAGKTSGHHGTDNSAWRMPRPPSKRGASITTPCGPTACWPVVRRSNLPRSLGVLASHGSLAPTRDLNSRTSHFPCSEFCGQVKVNAILDGDRVLVNPRKAPCAIWTSTSM